MVPPTFDAAPTIGALEIGILVAVCLFGAVSAVLYYTRFPSDSLFIKSLVSCLVWSLDLSHTIAICNAIYIITVQQYGHPEHLEFGWFAYRLFKFSHSIYLPLLCCVLSTLRACGSVVVGVLSFQGITVSTFVHKYGWIVETLLIIGAITDICFGWHGERYKKMELLVNRLMQWSIVLKCAALVSLGAIALLTCFVAMRDNFAWIGVSAVLPKLFSNSLLFALNVRKPLLRLAPESVQRQDSTTGHYSSNQLNSRNNNEVRIGDSSDAYPFGTASSHQSSPPKQEGNPSSAPHYDGIYPVLCL
ncbi:hypothetical protein B0H13DRAFT_1996844 [Mycena leptocephala]|nr:hypothetical protein B0H13DRAFT_1996844 [Mycena leptocephala]